MACFRWQQLIFLPIFANVPQSAAELLRVVEKFNMAAAAILDFCRNYNLTARLFTGPHFQSRRQIV